MQTWLVRLVLLVTCVTSFSLPPDFQKPHDFEEVYETCPSVAPPFPVTQTCPVEEITLLQGIYAASGSRKGVYRILSDEHEEADDHLQFWLYLTEACTSGECAVIQRISNTGQLLTPQIYVNSASKLLVLVYGMGQGRVLTYDKPIAVYTWYQVTVSLSEDDVRVCVRSVSTSHCHLYQDTMVEYKGAGPWAIGGSSHKPAIKGFIKDVHLLPEQSHQATLTKDVAHVNKLAKHPPTLSISLPELFMLCGAYSIAGVEDVRLLSDKHYGTECPAPSYPPLTTCNSSLTTTIESALRAKGETRLITELQLIHQRVSSLLNCTGSPLSSNITSFTSFPFTNLGVELKVAGEDALRRGNVCGGVTLLFLSGCYGDSETFFIIAALLKSGVLLPPNPLLASEVALGAVTQGSSLAHLALASHSHTCPLQFAYSGYVAEQFMTAWKGQEGDDLVTDRTRLHHGELGAQSGEDDQVFQFLLMQANQGNADAQANVGRMYYWGQGGVERNIDEAFNMQEQAAAQNHPDAMFDTGIMLMKGQGTTANSTKARDYLQKAAKVGHKGASGTLGYLELNEKNNITGAVHYFNHSHTLGDNDATHNLAIIHTYFKQFDPDPLYGFKMFKLAADRGHKDAALISAEHCLHGFKNITGNCETALRYIKKLSGSSTTVTKLMKKGVKLFQEGRYDAAFLNYIVLAEAGVEEAQYNVAWLCQEFEITLAPLNCSIHYYTMSAAQGYGPSQAILANHLWSVGRYYESARWYAKAAESDVMEGMFSLAYIAREGVSVGTVHLNTSSHYFGPTPNATLAHSLYSQCFEKGTEETLIACGPPLLFTSLSLLPTEILTAVPLLFITIMLTMSYICHRLALQV